MQAEEMWKTSQGEGITIAVIDTGVDPTLPDLQGQVLKGKDFSTRPGDAHDDYKGHGTGMAALIAATGAAGPKNGSYGLSPKSKILPLRIKGSENYRNEAEAQRNFGKDIGPAIRHAADSQAKIINISMGSGEGSPELRSAINYALAKGKMIFAATGNSGNGGNTVNYPAGTPGVIGISAVDKRARSTDESQSGKQVDLAAPGKDILGACLDVSDVCTTHGTSDATAIASASAALIWAEHPDWTANQVTRVLVNTAGGPKNGDERDDFIGHGVVRPRVALKNPGDPGDPNTNPLPGPYSERKAASDANKPAKPGGSDSEDDKQQAASGDDSAPNWLAYGLATAGILAAGGAAGLYVRHRRHTANTPYPTAPYGPGQPPRP
ncbi:type VII secretion-associated serine protease mycosin [Streptomyces oceani]|uniref:type VII secretion-associated serine protease mycosin n=1 Tax=Streptomyces oceani TaxID=1075402 RepID=UPI001481007D|nr:type VII secretion-associated serine protease mycosin [Streptomyces oceani]